MVSVFFSASPQCPPVFSLTVPSLLMKCLTYIPLPPVRQLSELLSRCWASRTPLRTHYPPRYHTGSSSSAISKISKVDCLPRDHRTQTAITSCRENDNSHPLWGFLQSNLHLGAGTSFSIKNKLAISLFREHSGSQLLLIPSHFGFKASPAPPSTQSCHSLSPTSMSILSERAFALERVMCLSSLGFGPWCSI